MALARTRVQLCGLFAVSVDGRRIEAELPGRQGRIAYAYLAANRLRTVTREELIETLWPDGRDGGLAPLLSKVRRAAPLDGLRPVADWIDVEAAVDALHRAESALVQGDPHGAWGPAQVAMFVSARRFRAAEEGDWIEAERRRLADVHLLALEAYAGAALGVGGTELAAAVRTGRELVRREPYRESGYRILIAAHHRQGNTAEALLAYDDLRTRLREELGISPSEPTQALHRQLLG